MTVRRNGKVLRVMKASMGRPAFATRNGTFIVLEKQRKRVMDSATVNLPPGTPAYKTAVEHAVRITNSGTFTHGAPVVGARTRACATSATAASTSARPTPPGSSTSPAAATSSRSSAAPAAPNSYDAGSRDWNMSFAEWKA